MNYKKSKHDKDAKSGLRFLQSLLMILVFLTSSYACGDSETPIDRDFKYIESIEVVSPIATNVKLDNFAHFIELDFEKGLDLSSVTIKVNLPAGVRMVAPTEQTSEYDLTKDASIKVSGNGSSQSYRIKVNLVNVPFNPSADKWGKEDSFGNLPEYISVYKYLQTIANKKVVAYIAVADMNNKTARFKVLGEKKGVATPKKFYDDNSKPAVVLNAGYFWAGSSLGLIIRDGKIISSQEPTYREYNGASTPYYPTQGTFGMNKDRTFSANYAYESKNNLYAYPVLSQNKAGDKPQPLATKDFPADAKTWDPEEAIGAGPLLIKDGEYKNNWEAELFDSFSGIGPTVNNPRSAVAYHSSGHVVFFVCEGRNKTPNTPGLTLKEVADLFLDLGCTDAINLDGGGSSCMLINGEETIIPSDNATQRKVANAIALY